MIIGICGKSGSGKSTLALKLMEKYNNSIYLDIDKIGHDIYKYKEVREELVKYFGSNVVNKEQVDRKALGSIVFNDKSKMDILTDITWGYMEMEIDNVIKNNLDKIIILDWILLTKTKYASMCDVKILLDIPYEVRKSRMLKRDNITSFEFDLRDSASISYDINSFDYVIRDSREDKIKWLVKLI